MNIFFLHKDPIKCAQMHCDAHVVKMVTEYAQLLSSAIWVHEPKLALHLYRKGRIYSAPPSVTGKRVHAHFNHPCMVWTRESNANYDWLHDLAFALAEEYWFRFGELRDKQHKAFLNCLLYLPKSTANFPNLHFRHPPLTMKEEFKQTNAVKAYRESYKHDKISFAKYTRRNIPYWLREVYYDRQN